MEHEATTSENKAGGLDHEKQKQGEAVVEEGKERKTKEEEEKDEEEQKKKEKEEKKLRKKQKREEERKRRQEEKQKEEEEPEKKTMQDIEKQNEEKETDQKDKKKENDLKKKKKKKKRNKGFRAASNNGKYRHPPSEQIFEKYYKALDESLKLSSRLNIAPIPGRTLVLCECSDEMRRMCGGAKGMGKRSMQEVAILLALMCKYAAEYCDLVMYSSPPKSRPK